MEATPNQHSTQLEWIFNPKTSTQHKLNPKMEGEIINSTPTKMFTPSNCIRKLPKAPVRGVVSGPATHGQGPKRCAWKAEALWQCVAQRCGALKFKSCFPAFPCIFWGFWFWCWNCMCRACTACTKYKPTVEEDSEILSYNTHLSLSKWSNFEEWKQNMSKHFQLHRFLNKWTSWGWQRVVTFFFGAVPKPLTPAQAVWWEVLASP